MDCIGQDWPSAPSGSHGRLIPIRELLAAVEPSSMIRTKPGHVAYLRSRVEQAGELRSGRWGYSWD